MPWQTAGSCSPPGTCRWQHGYRKLIVASSSARVCPRQPIGPTGIGAQPRNSRAKDVSVGPITNQTTPTRGCGWLTVRLLRTLLDRGGSQRGWLDRHLGGGKARVVLVRRRHLCSRLLSTETSVWLTEPMPPISCGLSRLAPGDLGRS